MNAAEVTLDQVLALARRLRPVDQARLVMRLAPAIEQTLSHPTSDVSNRTPLRGLLSDLGRAPSDAEITEAQHEMWSTFPSNAV